MRLARPAIALAAAAMLALALGACAEFKQGSLHVSQPGQIGPLHVEFHVCSSAGSPSPEENCTPNTRSGEAQAMLGIAVPRGASTPETITAQPSSGAPAFTLSRNQEVGARITELATQGEAPWLPSGDEIAGYLSGTYSEAEGEESEWAVAADFGLPAAADGGPFGGPATVGVVWGWRVVEEGRPADRPVSCQETEGSPPFITVYGGCELDEKVELGVSDLRIGSAAATVAAGGTASVPFTLQLASSAGSPSFSLAASSSLPGAGATPAQPTYAAAALDAGTHRATPAAVPVAVAVPPTTAPGTYDVTLTATAPAGGSVSNTAKLTVTSKPPPTIGVGKAKLNRRRGTATVRVTVSEAGTLSVTGRKVAPLTRKSAGAGSLKVTIRARGKAKKRLLRKGKSKVRASFAFSATAGGSATASSSFTLRRAKKHPAH